MYTVLIYLISYLMQNGIHAIGNIFLTKHNVLSHKIDKRELSLLKYSSNVATFLPLGLKKQRTRISKSAKVLDKMDLEYTNVYAPNIENHLHDLDEICLTDFAAIDFCKFMEKLILIMNQMMKKYITPVEEINEEKDLKTTITLKFKNDLAKKRKRTLLIVIFALLVN